MKKTQYIVPSIIVTEANIQNILAGSLGVDITKETNAQLSKAADLDFDDEDDEE